MPHANGRGIGTLLLPFLLSSAVAWHEPGSLCSKGNGAFLTLLRYNEPAGA